MTRFRSTLALAAALAISSAAQAEVLIDTFSDRGLLGEVAHGYDVSSSTKGLQQMASKIQLTRKVNLDKLAFASLNLAPTQPLVGSSLNAVLCVYADAAGRPGSVIATQALVAKVTAVHLAPELGWAPELGTSDVDYQANLNLNGALKAGKYWLAILGPGQFQLAFDISDAARNTAVVRTKPGSWRAIGSGAAQVRLEGTAAGLLTPAPKKVPSNSVCAP